MINYNPLWETMKDRGFTTYTLIKKYGFSTHTIYRLKHNGGISTSLINELCKILKCNVEDILQYTEDNDEL